jgi:hypothetical protein
MRHDAVDQPDRERLRGVHGPSGEDQVHRSARPDQARQADGTAVEQRHPPSPAEDAQHRVLLGDPQVAPQREFKPARNSVSGDRRDHRLCEP